MYIINIKKISYLILLSTLSIANANDNYIYKYKDANGKIIYADRLPSNEKGEVVGIHIGSDGNGLYIGHSAASFNDMIKRSFK